ncbi:MAG: uroporphyrinogen-III synthase [Candidatus Methanospirareceae archaeon]
MRVAITRPKEYENEVREIAELYGLEVFFAPMIVTRMCYEASMENFFLHLARKELDFVIFTSANSVRYMFDSFSVSTSIREGEELVEMLNRVKVVAIGPRTKGELEKRGIKVRVVPKEYSSRGIVNELCNEVRSKRVWVIRSKRGSEELRKGLEKCKAEVHEVGIYDIEAPTGEAEEKAKELMERIMKGEIDAITFTSRTCVRNFFGISERMGLEKEIKEKMKGMIVVAIGEPTAEELKVWGIRARIPKDFTFESVLREIKRVKRG